MKLGKYINLLLSDHEMVIVPGFGAFTIIDKPAQIDEENERILPPAKEVAFNPKITNNDGLLVGYVVREEKLSHAEALQLINIEKEEILYQLDKGEKFELQHIGIFSSDQSNQLQFEPFEREDNSPAYFGLTPTSLQNSEPAPIADTGKNNTEQNFEEQEFEPVEEIDPEFKKEVQKKRKAKSWLWLLLILIPLAGAGIYIYMNQGSTPSDSSRIEQINQPIESEPIVEEETPAIDDSLVSDSMSQVAEDTIMPEVSSPVQTGFNYYLIAGSFKEEENAEKYISGLQQDGYEPFRLGKRGDYYLVGLAVYKTEREALAAQDSFLMVNPESGAWVYEE